MQGKYSVVVGNGRSSASVEEGLSCIGSAYPGRWSRHVAVRHRASGFSDDGYSRSAMLLIGCQRIENLPECC